MVITHNISAMNSQRQLGIINTLKQKSSEKLSSGYKINRAADDAAGLSISEKMRKQIRGLDRGSVNSDDGISAVQTAEGALNEVHDMLQRLNELAVQAANGTDSFSDREAIQKEIGQLLTEIDRVAETTKFNELYMLKGGTATRYKTLNAHDAGLDGTLAHVGNMATFTTSLKGGQTKMIAGVNYNILEGTKEEETKALRLNGNAVITGPLDSIEVVRHNIDELIRGRSSISGTRNEENDISAAWVNTRTGDRVEINGTSYELIKNRPRTGSSDTFYEDVFEDNNGNEYSIDQIKSKISDGDTVRLSINATPITKTSAIPNSSTNSRVQSFYRVPITAEANSLATASAHVIRDYSLPNNITVSDALQLIKSALEQANNIGADTDRQARVTGISAIEREEVYRTNIQASGLGASSSQLSGNTIGGGSSVISIPSPTITPTIASITDSSYPTGVANNVTTASLSSYSSYTDDIGRTHYVLNPGIYDIADDITGVVFDVSGNTAIENSNLENVSISCAAGTTLSIKNLNINNYEESSTFQGIGSPIDFNGTGNVLNTYGENSFYGGYNDYYDSVNSYGEICHTATAAINVGANEELQINGTDSSNIKAYGLVTTRNVTPRFTNNNNSVWSTYSWAIGSNYLENGGSITINGGHIEAYSSQIGKGNGGAIGGGYGASIIINGGDIEAVGGAHGCIGAQSVYRGVRRDCNGEIKINGGIINALSYNSAAIGFDCGGNIEITDGIIYANGRYLAGTGIGAKDIVPAIKISGGYVYATTEHTYNLGSNQGTSESAPIGGSFFNRYANNGDISITGGTVVAISTENTQAIGNMNIETPNIKVYIDGVLKNTTGESDGNGHRVVIYPDMIGIQDFENDTDEPQNEEDSDSDANYDGAVLTDYKFNIKLGQVAIANSMNFNIHAGADADMTNKIQVDIDAMTTACLGLQNLNVVDDCGIAATYAIDAIEDAIKQVSEQRSELGAVQNRFEHTIKNLDNVVENTTAAESRIRDTDMAEEMVNLSKQNILAQAGQSMLAQANQSVNGVMSLLQG
nr:flagellin [Butyrivibrio sp. WCE2006]